MTKKKDKRKKEKVLKKKINKRKKGKRVKVSRKSKHSLDVNRTNGPAVDKGARSAATVRRLNMCKTRPLRNRKGRILKHKLQSEEFPNTRIEPDSRWFRNTRVTSQKEIEFLCEELQSKLSSNYNVILNERKLPLSLLNDHQQRATMHPIDTKPFQDASCIWTKEEKGATNIYSIS